MSEDNSQATVLILKGIAMWPRVFQPDTSFNSSKWSLDLLLDAEGIEVAKKHNLRIKKTSVNKQTGEAVTKYADLYDGYDGSYINITRNTHNYQGEPVEPPVVKDGKLRDIPSSVRVGNGSVMKTRFLVKNRNQDHIKEYGGFGCYLLGVQVLELVEYEGGQDEGGENDFVAEENAFVMNSTSDGGFDFESGDDIPFEPDAKTG